MTRLPLRHLLFFTACCLCGLGAWPVEGATPARAQQFQMATAAPAAQSVVSEGMGLMRKGVDGGMCALTFDDGPSRYTPALLDMLSVYTIPATFFVVGTQVERHPDTIRRMLAEGHEVGNHSYSHSALRKLSHEEQEMDLRKLDVRLRELGAKPRFVRPPYGFYDHNTVNAVQDLNGQLVMWSVDSQDWRKKDLRNDILSSMQTLYSGAPLRGVFLFHDTHRMTIENMPQIVDALKASGCRFVTLSEYIDAPWLQPDADPMQTALPDTPQPLAADATPAASSNAVQANQQAVSVSPLVSGEANSSELTPATQSTAPLEVTPPNSVAPTPAEPTGVIAWILSNVLIFPDEQTSLPK